MGSRVFPTQTALVLGLFSGLLGGLFCSLRLFAQDSVSFAVPFTGVNIYGSNDLNSALTFEAWVKKETEISGLKLVANISPADAARGAVIASPSRQNPDYFYFWVRDAALTMNVVVQFYAATTGQQQAQWQSRMDDYINFSRLNQLTQTLTGLGEPKFNADGTPFSDPWARPQNDSPALRALTLTRYAQLLLQNGQADYVRAKLYSDSMPAQTVIKDDLEYVAHHWQDKSFDLWEEVKGDHFYTRIVQMAALQIGGDLANTLGDGGAANFYHQQSALIHQDIEHFWDQSRGVIQATTGQVDGISWKTTGLDSAVILGVLHTGYGTGEFSPSDDRVLATTAKLEDSFRTLYSINSPARFPGVGTAIGRYPEDVFSGQANVNLGNPWVLATAALAELHYRLAVELAAAGAFTVDDLNLGFVLNSVGSTVGTTRVQSGLILKKGTPEFAQLLQKLVDRGDEFMKRIRLHANPDGSLSEQIDRNSGFMVSAHDLTWSYAGFITAAWARP